MKALLLILAMAVTAAAQAPTGANLFFPGDSRSTTYGHSTGEDWPAQFVILQWASGSSVTKIICAVSGATVDDMLDQYDTCVHPSRPSVTGKDGFMFCPDCAINSLHTGESPASIMAKLETLYAKAHADGIKVIAGTVPPNANDGDVLQKNRQRLNQLIGQSLTPDWKVPLAEITPNMGDAAISSDGLHFLAMPEVLRARAVNAIMMGEPVLIADDSIQSIHGTKQLGSLSIGGTATHLLDVHGADGMVNIQSSGNNAGWFVAQNPDDGSSAVFGIAHGASSNYPFLGNTPGAGVFGSGASGLPMEIAAAGEVMTRIRSDGNLEVVKAGKGLRLWSPNGSVCRILTIDNSGALTVSACP